MLRTISLTVLLLATAGPAFAHPGHEGSGFLASLHRHRPSAGHGRRRPVGVPAGGRKPAASFLVPAAFVAMMAVGAAAGFAGIKLPLVEAAILASVFVIGGLIMGAVRLPAASAMAVVGLFALFHGYAHALEAPATGAGTYILGFLTATALLQGVGLGLGWVVRRGVGDLGLRALGGMVVAGGALVLITN